VDRSDASAVSKAMPMRRAVFAVEAMTAQEGPDRHERTALITVTRAGRPRREQGFLTEIFRPQRVRDDATHDAAVRLLIVRGDASCLIWRKNGAPLRAPAARPRWTKW
jgi:hypothetical protein